MTTKILLVVDETELLFVQKLVLNKIKDNVLFVESGEEALDFLSQKEKSKDLELILLDLTMPGIDGYDVLKFMKKENIPINTILQTGIKDAQTESKARELGVTKLLYKPYSNNELKSCIEEYTNLKP